MTVPRLFLVAPTAPIATLKACLNAACEIGDVASLVVDAGSAELTPLAQAKGVAVLLSGDAGLALRLGSDGVHADAESHFIADLRSAIGKDQILGAYAGHSRHLAMEAAEAGADYVAFSQNGPSIGGVPLIAWWNELAEIPSVAFDPVEPDTLDILLPQMPDFIRPSDAMWESPESARRIVAALSQRLVT